MDKEYETSDIPLYAFLLVRGMSFIEIKESSPKHFDFIFSNHIDCEKLKNDFLNNASAPARELFSQREMLISEIKTKERNGNNRGASDF